MQITNYAVRIDFERGGPKLPKYAEFELYDAHKSDSLQLKSLYLTLQWVTGKHGDFRKAS